jgi:hypothetical protein
MTYRDDLIAKLSAEARFYQDEANALKEDEQRQMSESGPSPKFPAGTY